MLPRAASSSATVSLTVLSVSDFHRQALSEWRDNLKGLVARHVDLQHVCPARQRNASLRNQFSTAIRGAFEAIAAACAEPEAEIMAEAIAAVRRYFQRPGDARRAVQNFPAIIDLQFFKIGPEAADSLAELARQAEEAVATIGRILDCGEVWNFTGASMSGAASPGNPSQATGGNS